MKELPILFNTEMVQAVLAGRKTQTRRVMNPQPSVYWEPVGYGEVHKLVNGVPDVDKVIGWGPTSDDGLEAYRSIYGRPGDLLYVREPFAVVSAHYRYKSDGDWTIKEKESGEFAQWKPSIHMPKKAARIWLKVTDIQVERVQDITTKDIKAEGVTIPMADFKPLIPLTDKHFPHEYLSEFITNDLQFGEDELFRAFWIQLWNSINEDREYWWDENPWVWVVAFEVLSTTGKPEAL